MKWCTGVAAFLLLVLSAQAQKKQKVAPDTVAPPVAQSGPSFEATRDWITSTLAGYSGYFKDGYVYSNFKIDNSCRMTFHLDFMDDRGKPIRSSSGDITIPLGALTKVEGSIGEYDFLTFETGNTSAILSSIPQSTAPAFNNYQIFVSRQPPGEPGQPVPAGIVEIIPRLKNAFAHMTEVCKGTYQAPDVQKPPF